VQSGSGNWQQLMETSIPASQSQKESIHTKEDFMTVERVARMMASVRGTKPDYTRLAAELAQTIPFDVFGVVLLRHDRQALRVTVCVRDGYQDEAWNASHHQHPLEGSMLAQLLQAPTLMTMNFPYGLQGTPTTSGDALSGYPQLKSTLITPLLIEEQEEQESEQGGQRLQTTSHGRVLGALELGSTALGMYTDIALQRLIEAVARVLATAIDRAQLGGSDEIQNRQRQALKDVSTALTSKVDLSTILAQIVAGITQALGVASAIALLDSHGERLRLEAQAGLDDTLLSQIVHDCVLTSDLYMMSYSLRRRIPVASLDVANDERFPKSRAFTQELGIRSMYSYPLMSGTTLYGALLLCSPEPGGFTPLKIDILTLFASQATIAIHNGLLLEAAHRRSQFQKVIEQLEQAELKKQALKAGNGIQGSTEEQRDGQPVDSTEEYELLLRVREATQSAFGISFSSLLRFMSDHLLTQIEQKGPLADTLAFLTRSAETALMRVDMLGELGELLMQLRQSTNSVKDAWFVVDLHGTCFYMNPAAEILCGMRLEDVEMSHGIGDVFANLLPRMRNAEEVHLYLQECLSGNVYHQELRCVLALEPLSIQKETGSLKSYVEERDRTRGAIRKVTDGQTNLQPESAPSDYHYQLVRYPLHNQKQQLVGNALQMRDVTEQVRDEKNRSALLASVSHDLRTPLTTIKAAVTGLLQVGVEWDVQDLRAMLEDIDTETDHLTVLINALVELSRIEMGALTLEKEWCDVVEILYGALEKAGRILENRNVQVQVQPDLPLVHVDHVQMERVVYNLLENAVRNSPEKTEITVEVDTIPSTQTQLDARSDSSLLRVKVIDCGSGVPEYERERIFK
jgi:signal transduction histidine kinase/GAF domain-containing protein